MDFFDSIRAQAEDVTGAPPTAAPKTLNTPPQQKAPRMNALPPVLPAPLLPAPLLPVTSAPPMVQQPLSASYDPFLARKKTPRRRRSGADFAASERRARSVPRHSDDRSDASSQAMPADALARITRLEEQMAWFRQKDKDMQREKDRERYRRKKEQEDEQRRWQALQSEVAWLKQQLSQQRNGDGAMQQQQVQQKQSEATAAQQAQQQLVQAQQQVVSLQQQCNNIVQAQAQLRAEVLADRQAVARDRQQLHDLATRLSELSMKLPSKQDTPQPSHAAVTAAVAAAQSESASAVTSAASEEALQLARQAMESANRALGRAEEVAEEMEGLDSEANWVREQLQAAKQRLDAHDQALQNQTGASSKGEAIEDNAKDGSDSQPAARAAGAEEVKAEVERALAPALALLQATLKNDLTEAREAVIDDVIEDVREDIVAEVSEEVAKAREALLKELDGRQPSTPAGIAADAGAGKAVADMQRQIDEFQKELSSVVGDTELCSIAMQGVQAQVKAQMVSVERLEVCEQDCETARKLAELCNKKIGVTNERLSELEEMTLLLDTEIKRATRPTNQRGASSAKAAAPQPRAKSTAGAAEAPAASTKPAPRAAKADPSRTAASPKSVAPRHANSRGVRSPGTPRGTRALTSTRNLIRSSGAAAENVVEPAPQPSTSQPRVRGASSRQDSTRHSARASARSSKASSARPGAVPRTPCEYCGLELSAVVMRRHAPACKAKRGGKSGNRQPKNVARTSVSKYDLDAFDDTEEII